MSVGHLDLGRGAAAQGLVETLRVSPVHPPHGGQLDRFNGLPEPFGVDKRGLVEPVHCLGQGRCRTESPTVPTEALTLAVMSASE